MLILLLINLVILALGVKDALRLNYLISSMAIEWIAVLSEHLKKHFYQHSNLFKFNSVKNFYYGIIRLLINEELCFLKCHTLMVQGSERLLIYLKWALFF